MFHLRIFIICITFSFASIFTSDVSANPSPNQDSSASVSSNYGADEINDSSSPSVDLGQTNEKEWYGHLIYYGELLDVLGIIPYFLTAPIIHIRQGQPMKALQSFGARVTFPVLGGIAGGVLICPSGPPCSGFNILIPLATASLGFIAAVIFDAQVLAYKEVQVQTAHDNALIIGEPVPKTFSMHQPNLLHWQFRF